MISLNTPRGALVLLLGITTIYITVVISGLRPTIRHYSNQLVQEDDGPGDGSNVLANSVKSSVQTYSRIATNKKRNVQKVRSDNQPHGSNVSANSAKSSVQANSHIATNKKSNVQKDRSANHPNGSNVSANSAKSSVQSYSRNATNKKRIVQKVRSANQPHALIGLTPMRQDLSNLDVAIIVCYRDREIHLKIFINYMNSFLFSQNSSARIYVVEQHGKDEFNRAKLFNVGYAEAKKDYNYTCFIFHDIDLLPENPKLIYRCAKQPLHMSAYIDKFNYRLPYMSIFGGVSGLSDQQLKKVNGFPNAYWGWGGEDDDISRRVRHVGFKINRPPAKLARYTMLRATGKHTRGKANAARFGLLRRAAANMAKDGLNTLDYEVVEKVDYKTYIWVLADLKRNEKVNPKAPKRASPKGKPAPAVPTIPPKTKPPIVVTPECKKKQVARSTMLKKACDSHKREFSNSNINAWHKQHSNILVLKREKAVFCFIPMAASAEWKTKILTHRGVIKEQAYKGADIVEPNNAIQNTLRKYDIQELSKYRDAEVAEILKTHYKFAFFLNPYTKLIMAFEDKLNNTHNTAYGGIAKRMLKELKIQPPFNFEKFMSYLVKTSAPQKYDIHWQRSVDMCNPCHINYDFVGQVETLAADASCVLPHLGMSPWFPSPPVFNVSKLETDARKVYSALPTGLIAKVEKIFGIDAAMFGYKMPGKQ